MPQKRQKKLEIGPGPHALPGFLSVDVVGRLGVDCLADARALPFASNTFDLLYASHVIEHVPWWQADEALKEWRRVLAPGGRLEVWTVDAAKIAEELLIVDRGGPSPIRHDGWQRHNPDADPYRWINGRIFAYGSDASDPNWHKSLWTLRSLRYAFTRAGFRNVHPLLPERPRGYDHRWINMGVTGTC